MVYSDGGGDLTSCKTLQTEFLLCECDCDVLLYYLYCRHLGDRVYSFQDRFLTLIIILCPPIITYSQQPAV